MTARRSPTAGSEILCGAIRQRRRANDLDPPSKTEFRRYCKGLYANFMHPYPHNPLPPEMAGHLVPYRRGVNPTGLRTPQPIQEQQKRVRSWNGGAQPNQVPAEPGPWGKRLTSVELERTAVDSTGALWFQRRSNSAAKDKAPPDKCGVKSPPTELSPPHLECSVAGEFMAAFTTTPFPVPDIRNHLADRRSRFGDGCLSCHFSYRFFPLSLTGCLAAVLALRASLCTLTLTFSRSCSRLRGIIPSFQDLETLKPIR